MTVRVMPQPVQPLTPTPPARQAAPIVRRPSPTAALAAQAARAANRPGARQHRLQPARARRRRADDDARHQRIQGVEFGIRSRRGGDRGQLSLSGAMSPSLIPEVSNIPSRSTSSMSAPSRPAAISSRTDRRCRSTGVLPGPQPAELLLHRPLHTGMQRPAERPAMGTVSDTSTLTLTSRGCRRSANSSRLPLPFFDGYVKDLLSLPFVLPANPSPESLKSAGIVASWFGGLAVLPRRQFPGGDGAAGRGQRGRRGGRRTRAPAGIAGCRGSTARRSRSCQTRTIRWGACWWWPAATATRRRPRRRCWRSAARRWVAPSPRCSRRRWRRASRTTRRAGSRPTGR